MNILPKKRWHVRTKDNIARVRRDEALAAEQQKEENRRIQLAESEARLRYMKSRIGGHCDDTVNNDDRKESTGNEHINFFQELENGDIAASTAKTNVEYELEKKREKEKYEKQIGYLTYLGQDTNEATGKTSWYNVAPSKRTSSSVVAAVDGEPEKAAKEKYKLDPINKYKKYFHILPDSGKRKQSPPLSPGEQLSKKSKPTEKMKSKKKKKKKKKSKKKDKKAKRLRRDESAFHSTSLERTNSTSSGCSEEDEIKEARIKEQSLTLLRQKRLERERQEKLKADKVLAKLRGVLAPSSSEVADNNENDIFEQKYNSQFNPHLAKQNVKSVVK